MLHTFVGSFAGEWKEQPKQGHFIFARIQGNQVMLNYAPVIPFQIFLFKEYGVFTLQIVDSDGNIRDDATVKIRGRFRLFDVNVPFDKISKTYSINDASENTQRILSVKLDGFETILDMSKHLVYLSWYGKNNSYRPDFYSYMITDKNKYKPGDSVRFKSYALSQQKRPLTEELEVWLHNTAYKKISKISPYHQGGYAGKFVLHDSLKLRLDSNCNLQLRNKKGQIIANTNFSYEDYELHDSKIETKFESNVQYFPDTNRIEIKAVDANGLFLQDRKAEITITRKNVLNSYTDLLILPDILFAKQIDMNNDKPSTVSIPPDIFGESDCEYQVNVKVYTHDNQMLTSRNHAVFYKSKHNIAHSTVNDTICFIYSFQGKEMQTEAELCYNGEKKGKIVRLPYKETFNQSIKQFDFRLLNGLHRQTVKSCHINPKLNIEGGILADSFNVKLINPLNLNLSWYIYQGNTLLEKGAGKEFDFRYPNTDLDVEHYVEIFYFMGDEEKSYHRVFVPKTEFLDVNINLPERIYPGQTLDALVTVKNNFGKPVKNVDITAFAYNAQLNYFLPDLPYYGASPQSREQRSSYSVSRRKYSSKAPLDYRFWNGIAKLDTAVYYRFIYPRGKLFTHTVSTPDSVTQFAPFVMKNGQSVDIYVVEIDGKPAYFSWTNQPKTYSFPVADTGFHKIVLRLHDCAVILDSLTFEKGKKTIFSMEIDYKPAKTKIIKLDRYFTEQEKKIYSRYVSKIPVADICAYTYLKDSANVYPVFHECFNRIEDYVTAGPLPQGYMQYLDRIKYRHEGGYMYKYEDNMVYKYPFAAVPNALRFSSSGNFAKINDFALTASVFNKIVENCRRDLSWRPKRLHLMQNEFDLNFTLPMDKDSGSVCNLLFRNVKTGEIIYPARYNFEPKSKYRSDIFLNGIYDVILLYNSGNYLCFNSLPVRNGTYIDLNMNKLPLHKKDSLSQKWLSLFEFSPCEWRMKNEIRQNDIYYLYWTEITGDMVHGVILDENGEPLVGASIILKGTKSGVISDIDGRFKIAVDSYHNTLTVLYLGYEIKEIEVTKGEELTVQLEPSELMLEEVIVTAYGGIRKKSISYSVTSIAGAFSETQSPPEKVEDNAENETIQAENKLYENLLQLNGLRNNFSDVGFWRPDIYTDRNGEARFTVTFPDNITQWNTVVYAMNRQLKTGTARKYIRSYKPIMGELKTPQFLVVGDSSCFAGNIRNYTADKEIDGTVIFSVDSDTILNEPVKFSSSRQDRLPVSPSSTDSITATYMFRRSDGYSDGEKRTISVVRQGAEIADGTLEFLQNGDVRDIIADDEEEIHVSFAANQLDIYMDDALYLASYRYDCNEQLASKLIGLLHFKLYQNYTGKPFTHDKRITGIIKKLDNNRNDKKLWSWFGNASSTSYWVSAHVIRALNLARKSGYPVNLNLSTIEQDYADIEHYRSISLHDVEMLNVLSEAGTVQNYRTALNLCDRHIARLEYIDDSIARAKKIWNSKSYFKEKMLLLEIRQKQKIDWSAQELLKYQKKDIFGGIYFDDGIYGLMSGNTLEATLIAYRIISADSALHHLKTPVQMYILRTKQNRWNTYQTSSAIMTVLPDLLAASAVKDNLATVRLEGKENRTITEFPYSTTLKNGERLHIEKETGMPLIYSVYKMKHVTAARSNDVFDVHTSINARYAGTPVTLTVTVNVKRENAEYVMIEVPIPASCSYLNKNGSYTNYEVYREYFKDRVVIFCEKLPKGIYQYDIELLPRYTGTYILNPAKVEMMYFPVINANEKLKKIKTE
jgi:hypothetical protein